MLSGISYLTYDVRTGAKSGDFSVAHTQPSFFLIGNGQGVSSFCLVKHRAKASHFKWVLFLQGISI